MITQAIAHWRKNWAYKQQKHGLGPVDEAAWAEYVNGLTMNEVLEALAVHGDVVEHMEPHR